MVITSALIEQYFPDLSDEQKQRFAALYNLYVFHNERVNVISRKDMDNFYIHHVLHSLALVKFCDFSNIQSVIDIGTGGGFPGIPLAIMFPDIKFHLVDSIGKKINVVNEVAKSIGLKNILAEQQRTENSEYAYDLAVARAVAPTIKLYDWMQSNWLTKPKFYLLKGGDLSEELNELLQVNPKLKIKSNNISKVFKEDFFETKKVITIE